MPKSLRRFVLYGIFFALFSITIVQPIFASPPAQDATSGPPSRQNGSAANRRQNLQHANTPAELLTKAQQRGQVRVIVGLNLNTRYQPEGGLSSAQAAVQRNAITQARQSLLQNLTSYRATVLAHSNQWTIPYVALRINAAGLRALQTSPQVGYIQEDHLNFATNNVASLTKMGVPAAWTNGYDGSGLTVAVIDTGVQTTHTFLGGRVVDEYCSSTSDNISYLPQFLAKPVCPGGVTEVSGAGAANPATCANLNLWDYYTEKCDHGTHVAGIAAGNDGNDTSVNDGVARGANIIAIQAFTYMECQVVDYNYGCYDVFDGLGNPVADGYITAYDADLIAGLNHVYSLRNTYQIASVNMSIGGGAYDNQDQCDAENFPIKDAIDQLRSVNIATVIASGNEFYGDAIAAPGCISTAVAVGSVSDVSEFPGGLAGKISSFTNTHAMLDLLAPGYLIFSSVTVPPNTGFENISGTSMATPQVTGAWAVVRDAYPNATVTQILGAFQASGTPVLDNIRADGYKCGYSGLLACSGLTFKLINVNGAINWFPSTPTLTAPVESVMTPGKPTLKWTALRATQYRLFLDTVNPPAAGYILVNTPYYTPPTSLEPKIYYWQVQALNKLGAESYLSAIHSFSVDVAANRNYSTATPPPLTWTPISWATSYEVQIADNSTFTLNPTFHSGLPAGSLSLDVSLPIGTHYWRVRAYDGLKAGTWSPTETITVGS